MTKYTYSIQSDFPNHCVATDRLVAEIRASAIVVALDCINTDGDACDIWFKADLSGTDEAVLDGLVASHQGEPLPSEAMPVALRGIAEDPDHRLRISQEPRKVGSGLIVVTHNWCDPTTWYTQSVRVTGEALEDSGDGLTFGAAHENWIDLTHGKIYREDLISAPYKPVVRVDGVVKTERDPWAVSGGDYQINYAAGTVTFFSSQAGKAVTADYSYANGSMFVIAPAPGKRLWVEYSEVQFSKDIDIKSTTHFQPWAYNPANPPSKIPVAAPTTYKTLDNYIEEANGCYPTIPTMGGARGTRQDRVTFPFHYPVIKELLSSLGLEIRIWLESDVSFGGEYGTATFYCTSYSEG